ncbi:MAG: DUF2029 domain-containing protein [Acidobacteria bacterium]|nr:DUF2029 domain-containing protein [Acidobacteriota bacterium]
MILYARLGEAIGLAGGDVLRLVQTLADAATAGFLCLIAIRVAPRYTLLAPAIVLIAPASIFVSGFHGNTDPTMLMLIAASLWLLVRGNAQWLAGVTLALAASIKLVPIVLVPVILAFLAGKAQGPWRFGPAARFLAAFTVTFVVAFIPPVLAGSPRYLHNVFGYTPAGGGWGITGILQELSLTPEGALRYGIVEAADLYHGLGKWLILVVVGAFALVCFRSGISLEKLPAAIHLSLSIFLCLSPGFGVQYLSWLIPFAIFTLTFRQTLLLVASVSLYLYVTYTIWCRELTWYYANALWEARGGWIVNWLAIPLWLLLVWLTVSGVRHLSDSPIKRGPELFETAPGSFQPKED